MCTDKQTTDAGELTYIFSMTQSCNEKVCFSMWVSETDTQGAVTSQNTLDEKWMDIQPEASGSGTIFWPRDHISIY